MLDENILVVIPAYNESDRLPPFLGKIKDFFLDQPQVSYSYRILVVDDGSSDNMVEKIKQIQQDWAELEVLRLPENRGKGAAVRTGVLQSKEDMILVCDADGATPIEEIKKLLPLIDADADIVCGSRLLQNAKVKRSFLRSLSGKLFACLVRKLAGLSVSDSQCGFKLMKGDCARKLFRISTEDRYAYDIEILSLAECLRYTIKENGICWHEVSGSKVNLIHDGLKMIRDTYRIRSAVSQKIALASVKQKDIVTYYN
ncbi:dolichyl-phosphate beta-glucosyltransferase [Gimesia panareensis]|uniref:dolichyl-phosphate beta-glucosyltransferase n=1 Tax=Gimesia panareensis TaxID=2527978 RepID=UPI0011893556|nr:dolichyl-phosphate beta-glucosyltransferase [Gimesia panareensis]QDU52142.1 Undecaprenyl-phosphate 4-deoxy-4-formamido-L-arabinose transferase [Gimesia panareensis]